ncbi:hypothetical protein AURDEDRAFT_129010 [Auricularia subglabra TFB-10046 SS5]|nr:hypothetical protein AURDEDRAFT_129010 [Auricularia subglabra TFB-10046 SS5]
MSTIRRRRKARERQSSGSAEDTPPVSKRQRNKANKEHYERLRARVASFVQEVVNPGLKDIGTEFDVPVADVRELAHLAIPAVAKQRRLSLWQTVVSVEAENTSDIAGASKRASEKYAELKQAIDADDLENEDLVLYETKRKELEQEREPVKLPSTTAKADRAVIADVTRGGKQIEDMQTKLHALRNSADIEFCVFICPGNDRVVFPPHVYRSPKAADFFKLKTKLDSLLFAQEMAGYTQHGAKVYELLAVKDPQHKTFVSELLTAQLREMTGNPKIRMQWVECKQMCAKYDIRLVSWPDDIDLLPMEKTAISKARRLHLLIREGKIRFERALDVQDPAPAPARSPPRRADPPSSPNTSQSQQGSRTTSFPPSSSPTVSSPVPLPSPSRRGSIMPSASTPVNSSPLRPDCTAPTPSSFSTSFGSLRPTTPRGHVHASASGSGTGTTHHPTEPSILPNHYLYQQHAIAPSFPPLGVPFPPQVMPPFPDQPMQPFAPPHTYTRPPPSQYSNLPDSPTASSSLYYPTRAGPSTS